MVNQLRPIKCVWNYLSISTLYRVCDYLTMLGLKLIHVSKRGPCWSTASQEICTCFDTYIYEYTAVFVTLWRREYMKLRHEITSQRSKVDNIFKSQWFSLFLVAQPSNAYFQNLQLIPDSQFHGANMGPTWVLSAPDGPYVGCWSHEPCY